MSQHWIFNEPGSIPGIPGIWANCRIEVKDDGELVMSTLSGEGYTNLADGLKSVISAPVPTKAQSSEVVQEPVQTPAQFFKEG